MTKSKYDWQLNYRRLITEKPYMMFFLGLVFTIIFGMGLKGLSQNPDNRIFFSDDDPNLVALETLENTYTKNDNLLLKWLKQRYMIGQNSSFFIEVLMTAYNPLVEQTDSTPFEAASGKTVREGYVAVSKDLESRFPLGSFIEIVIVCEINQKGDCLNSESEQVGDIFRLKIEDRMHPRKKNQIDIFFMCKEDAIDFGRRKALLLF